ncbi:MAG: nuclear transport factor 2 family protein [Burkholderiales bacterium]
MADVVPSEELRALLLRMYDAWAREDFAALRDMFSTGAHVVVIGTDPDEWWRGAAGLEVLIAQTREMGGVRFEPHEPVAYSLGNVGWVVDRPAYVPASGHPVPLRSTAILAIERGHWRFVHWHVSIGQANEDALGLALPTSIARVERSVRNDRPDLAPVSAPDGTVTILFSDIESSTVLLERLGDTGYVAMLAWHDGIVRDAAAEHKGYVVKSQGDGFMLAFPSAAFALRAALVMHERIAAGFEGLPVRIRAGLHAGEALRHDHDFFGRTVVIAARISALALGGEILVSDLVYGLVRGLGAFNFGPRRNAVLKGLDGSFDLYPVLP